jgi:drug/metabolite transporter (DMT)-like permease
VVPGPAVNQPMPAVDWVLLIILAILWGGSFFFMAIALRELPPLTAVALRIGIGAALLAMLSLVVRQPLRLGLNIFLSFMVMGALNNVVPFALIGWALRDIPSGLAAILNATTPLFTVVVAHAATLDEKITVPRSIGLLIGFAGVVVMVGRSALINLNAPLSAQLLCLAAAFCYALAGVYGRRFRRLGITPIQTAAGQLMASTILIVPLAVAVDCPCDLHLPSLAGSLAILAAGALSTALGYVLYFRILSSAGATNLLLVTFLIPVSAVGLGTIVLHEPIDTNEIAGMALIGLGLASIDGRLFRFLRWKPARP